MADLKISALTAATTPLAGTEVVPLVQSSTTKKVSIANLTAGRAVDVSSLNINNTVYTGLNPRLALQQSADGDWRGMVLSAASTDSFVGLFYNGTSWSFQTTYLTTGAVKPFTWGYAGDVKLTLDVTGNLVPAVAAKGINFTANTPAAGMTSQLLNWYEEGTWTPFISDGTNNATNIPQVGGSYTRVGRLVTLTGTVATSSLGSVTGNIRLTGFPFATPTQFYAQSAGVVTGTSGLNITAGQSLSLLMDRTSAFAYIQISDAATGNSMMTATQWSADGGMTFCISYVVE